MGRVTVAAVMETAVAEETDMAMEQREMEEAQTEPREGTKGLEAEVRAEVAPVKGSKGMAAKAGEQAVAP